jgi:hypothetical protein
MLIYTIIIAHFYGKVNQLSTKPEINRYFYMALDKL